MNAPSPLPDSADHWPTPVEPPNFQFIEESLGLEVEEGALEAAGGGCSCSEGACSLAAGCECCRRNPLGPLYDGAGRLIVFTHRTEQDDTIFECGPSCSCGAQCGNAITQRGARPRLRLAELPGKGWGVLADEPISAGAFVSNYVGEYVTTEKARQRLEEYDAAGAGHALLVVREVLPSGGACLRVNIDATLKGNLARFFNHSCDGGNLDFVTVRHVGALLPRVAFFARKDIAAGEELCFFYGPPNAGPAGHPCCCGTAECLGFLPHEDV